MKKPLTPVTDHALIRYLERVEGIDIEAIRLEIGRRVDAALRGCDGACGVVIDGFSYRITPEGAVVTVIKTNRPERGQVKHRHRREFDDG